MRWQGPPFPSDRVSFDPHARVKDMDIEGVDVNMILPSGGVPAFAALEDVALEQAMYQAYHRYVSDYCAPYPDRLTSVILVTARDPAGRWPRSGAAAARRGRWASSPSAPPR